MATSDYLARGNDGYDVFAKHNRVIDCEQGIILPVLLRNFLFLQRWGDRAEDLLQPLADDREVVDQGQHLPAARRPDRGARNLRKARLAGHVAGAAGLSRVVASVARVDSQGAGRRPG
ncbi:hypothetical protein DIPPA_24153 [Diplonema papillatum]|nr:hypothetical protein DIPPA_24153 [Diplonema papillatum]